jgi:hypothetical protein
MLTHLSNLGLGVAAASLIACSKAPEAPPAPDTTATVAAAPDALVSPAPAPVPKNEAIVIAKVGDRVLTSVDVTGHLEAVLAERRELDEATLREAIQDLIDDVLLADEARKNAFTAPADPQKPAATPPSDEDLAAAWGRHLFFADAKASVTEADLSAWFAERRGVARAVLPSEADAKSFHDAVVAAFAARPTERVAAFREVDAKMVGRKGELTPDGILVDRQGKSETGEPILAETAAAALFELAEDGAISAPIAVGTDAWMVVQRVGLRPALALASVPPVERDKAHEMLAAHRAMNRLQEHAERLRKDQKVEIDEQGLKRLALKLGVDRVGKVRRMPIGMRKIQLQRVKALRSGDPAPAMGIVGVGGPSMDRTLQDKLRERIKNSHGADQSSPDQSPPQGPAKPGAHP